MTIGYSAKQWIPRALFVKERYALKVNQLGEQFKIGVSWKWWIVCFMGVLFFAFLYFTDYQSVLPRHSYPVVELIIFLILLLFTSRSFVLKNDGITVYLFLIPIYQIGWDSVEQILLFKEDRSHDKHSKHNYFLLITLSGCNPYVAEIDNASDFARKYFFNTIQAELSEKSAKELVSFFEVVDRPIQKY